MNNSKSRYVIEIIDDDFSDNESDQNNKQQKSHSNVQKRKRDNWDVYQYYYGEADCSDSDDEEEDDENASDADSNGNLKGFVTDGSDEDEEYSMEEDDTENEDWYDDDDLLDVINENNEYEIHASKKRLLSVVSDALDKLAPKKKLVKPNKETQTSFDNQEDCETLSD